MTVLELKQSNTILYCGEEWADTVAFYRDRLGLAVTFANDWFVELVVHSGGHISVADASRASIAAGDGRGLTLSWEVPDLGAAVAALTSAGISVSVIGRRFGSSVVDMFDPAGNRIELWERGA